MKRYLAVFAALAMAFTAGACDDDDEITDPGGDPLLTGSIQVSVATTGSDLDPDGYVATVQEDTLLENPSFNPNPESQDLAINGNTTFDDQVTGPHTLTLSGIAVNCEVAGANPREVRVQEDQVTLVDLTVSCASETDEPQANALLSDDARPAPEAPQA